MRKSILEKKEYQSPSFTTIGAMADKTKGGRFGNKRVGSGDQFIFTDPPNCWEGPYYNNCEDASA